MYIFPFIRRNSEFEYILKARLLLVLYSSSGNPTILSESLHSLFALSTS